LESLESRGFDLSRSKRVNWTVKKAPNGEWLNWFKM
jgi:hypothetical protein